MTEQPRSAFHQDHPCELAAYHAPEPVVTEYHHSRPVYLQNHLYGRIKYPADTWLCSNCHEAVHSWIYYRMGERKRPPRIGRNAVAEAERTLTWFYSEADQRQQ